MRLFEHLGVCVISVLCVCVVFEFYISRKSMQRRDEEIRKIFESMEEKK